MPVGLPPANLTFIGVSSICVFYLWFSLSVGYLRSRYHERLLADTDENVQAYLARTANCVIRNA